MNLRDYLEQREKELTAQIDRLRGQLIPLEAELAEIQRAKASIGLMPSRVLRVGDRVGQRLAEWESVPAAVNVPYHSMTMKQLIVKALDEQFRDQGSTAKQLAAFFRDNWGRDIERSNLSPQLSRLYQEDVVGRIRSTKGWFLIKPEMRIPGQRPYLHANRIIWMEPMQTDENHEPLVVRAFEADVGRDRLPYRRVETTTMPNGLIDRRTTLVWLFPHEVQDHDAPALRHEFPPSDDDGDNEATGSQDKTIVSGSFTPAGITTRALEGNAGKRRYRLQQDARHNDRMLAKGAVVWLGPDDAIEPWHELIDQPKPG